jgi:hypothetical protein
MTISDTPPSVIRHISHETSRYNWEDIPVKYATLHLAEH